MKTAPIIPNSVIEEVETLAQRLGISLSDFYTEALTAYCKKYSEKQQSDRQHNQTDLNQFYAEESSQLDPVIAQMQFASIPHEEW
jgi:ClpP class serine protease